MTRYPLLEKPLDQFHYMWTEADGNPNASAEWMARYAFIEQALRDGKFVTIERHDTHLGRVEGERGLYHLTQDQLHQIQVQKVYFDLLKNGMDNELWVYEASPGVYVTLRGNRRLCALRAAGHRIPGFKGAVNCRVSTSWRFGGLMQLHPYQ